MIDLMYSLEKPDVLSCMYTWEPIWRFQDTIHVIAEGVTNRHVIEVGSISHAMGAGIPKVFPLNRLEEGNSYALCCRWTDGTALPESAWKANTICYPFSGEAEGWILKQKQGWHLIELKTRGNLPAHCLGIKTIGVPLRLFPKLPENGQRMRYWIYSPSGDLHFETLFPLKKTPILNNGNSRGRN